MLVPAARRAQLVHAGRIGGLTTAARNDMSERARGGQAKFKARFLFGHECAVCPATVISPTLPERERRRRSSALYFAHMARMRRKPRPS